jgi:hypothetical protein
MHQLLIPPLLLLSLLSGISSSWVIACDATSCTCQETHGLTQTRQQGCWIATSTNFHVRSFQSANEARHVALHCEEVRDLLSATYGLTVESTCWSPKCEVFLFLSKHKYGAVVGREAMETLGSSLVRPETGTVQSRRIDLRTDVPNYLQEVLAHELTHVLIADHFRDGPPPLWYDEGLALLADSQSKQALHQRDLRIGMNRGTVFSVSELLTAKQYPTVDRVSVFYGQCASMARCLYQEGSPEKIHEFAKRSQEIGVNLALKECYGVAGLPDLEQRWRKGLNSPVAVTLAHVSLSKNSMKFSPTSVD